jgi:hypothetical protein
VKTRLLAMLTGLMLVVPVSTAAVSAQELAPATNVTFSKPLIVPFPTANEQVQAFGLRKLGPSAVLPAQEDPCNPTSTPSDPTTPAPSDVPVGPPPAAMMATLLTNNSGEMQSYMITATQTSSGANLGQGVAAFVRPGQSSIPMFVLQDVVPSPDDVSFSATLFDFPPLPCDNSPQTANLQPGAPTLDGMSVLVPVTNLDQSGYSTIAQAGLLNGEYLVAVSMGSVTVAGGATATADTYVLYPFGSAEVPAHTSIVPALMHFGTTKAG